MPEFLTHDELDLTEKLQRVLRDGSLVQSYRHRAQIRVQKYYDWDRVVDQYEELFAEMAGIPHNLKPRSRQWSQSLGIDANLSTQISLRLLQKEMCPANRLRLAGQLSGRFG